MSPETLTTCPRCAPAAPPATTTTVATLALVGNPNAGKTSVFNALTGQHQHVGNWPGKTVAYQEGLWPGPQGPVRIVDLPGTYSLAALSPEERLARDALLQMPFDAVLNVVDASHLGRHLYLTAEVLELGLPTLVVLNMWDVARREGIRVDVARLEELLGVPVVPTVARDAHGTALLQQRLGQWLAAGPRPGRAPRYPARLEQAAAEIQELVAAALPDLPEARLRGLALKMLEDQTDLLAALLPPEQAQALAAQVQARVAAYRRAWGEDPALLVADARYGWVQGVLRAAVTSRRAARFAVSQALDRLVTHRWLGLPLFFLVMLLVFHLVVNVADPFITWTEGLFQGPVRHGLLWLLDLAHAPLWLRSLVVDGIVAGVGSMMTFLPGLVLLYLFLAWLEDSGYMARVAFVMDRAMRAFGLHGKAFLPLLLGLGCNVPAVYATRTLERHRDRLVTALVIPFMSCSARLPVYLIFGLAFFGPATVWVVWGLYLLGLAVALGSAWLLQRVLLPAEPPAPFVLELPSYHWPNARVIGRQVSQQVRAFVVQAGTVIVGISTLLWLLMNLPWGVTDPRASAFGRVSQALAPALAPLGFGRWEAAGALFTGMVAKEVVVSTMGQIYLGEMHADAQSLAPPTAADWQADLRHLGPGLVDTLREAGAQLLGRTPPAALSAETANDGRLAAALRQNFSRPAALAFVVFTLLYVPCMATLAAQYHEFGARWAAFALGYQVSVAWLLAWVTYHLARGLGL